jgi:hypothetical protein
VPISIGAYFYFHVGSMPLLAASFAVAGLVNGVQDTLEGATTGTIAPSRNAALRLVSWARPMALAISYRAS